MSLYLDLERLRQALSRSQFSNIEIQYICDNAKGEIDEAILSIVSSAVGQAIDYAIDIGADEFVNDVQIVPESNGLYQISTHSGIMNYSKDKKEMLEHLLRNAKVSKDGSRYKVIPISQKETKVQHSMFSTLQVRQDAMDESRKALRQQANLRREVMTDVLRTNLARQVSASQVVKNTLRTETGNKEFRTASDKQDPSAAWVIPKKEADMSDYIYELNQSIILQSRETIESLINYYYSSYVGT